MKNMIKLMVAVIAALICIDASGQEIGTFNGLPVTVSNTTTTVTSGAVKIPTGKGIAILPKIYATTPGASNVVLQFEVSADNVTFTTETNLTHTVTLRGTNRVVTYTNFTTSQLKNIQWIRLQSVRTDFTNNAVVTNVQYSIIE